MHTYNTRTLYAGRGRHRIVFIMPIAFHPVDFCHLSFCGFTVSRKAITVARVKEHTFFPCLRTCTLGQESTESHLKFVQNPVFEVTMVIDMDAFLGEVLEVLDPSKCKHSGRHLRAGLFYSHHPKG